MVDKTIIIAVNRCVYPRAGETADSNDTGKETGIRGVALVDDWEEATSRGAKLYFGAPNDCRQLQLLNGTDFSRDYPNVFYRPFALSCYYWQLRGLLLNFNDDSYFCHVGHLGDGSTAGDVTGLFCRSDAGDTLYKGRVISGEVGVGKIKESLSANDLLFLARARDIESIEYRCWADKGQLIACSAHNGKSRCSKEPLMTEPCADKVIYQIAPIVKEAYQRYPIFEPYVVNLCAHQGMLKIVDLGAFCSASFLDHESFSAVMQYAKSCLI